MSRKNNNVKRLKAKAIVPEGGQDVDDIDEDDYDPADGLEQDEDPNAAQKYGTEAITEDPKDEDDAEEHGAFNRHDDPDANADEEERNPEGKKHKKVVGPQAAAQTGSGAGSGSTGDKDREDEEEMEKPDKALDEGTKGAAEADAEAENEKEDAENKDKARISRHPNPEIDGDDMKDEDKVKDIARVLSVTGLTFSELSELPASVVSKLMKSSASIQPTNPSEDDLPDQIEAQHKGAKPNESDDELDEEDCAKGDDMEECAEKKTTDEEKDPAEKEPDGDEDDKKKSDPEPEKLPTDRGQFEQPEDSEEKADTKVSTQIEDHEDGDEGGSEPAGEGLDSGVGESDKPSKPDGKVPVTKGVFGEFKDAITKSGFPHAYDEVTDTFMVHYGMKVSGAMKSAVGDDLEIVKAAFGTRAGNAPDFHPTDEEKQKIDSMTGKEYPREMLKVYYTYSADSQLDRHFEVFGAKALDNMALMSIDQPVMKDHNYQNSDGVFGKIFDAKVIRGKDGGRRLIQKIYVLNTPENKSVIDGIESGINNKLSVGVRMIRKEYLCNICNKPMFVDKSGTGFGFCGHLPGMELGDGRVASATIGDIQDMMELSRVTVPAQRNAGIKGYDAALAVSKLTKSFEVSKSLAAALNNHMPDIAKISEDNQGESLVSVGENSATDAIAKIVAGFETSMKSVSSSFELVLKTQNELSSQIESSLSDLVKLTAQTVENTKSQGEDLKARELLLQKQVAETREFLVIIANAHKDLAAKCGIVIEKSNEDIARYVASARAYHGQDEATNKKSGDDGFYTGVADRFR